MIIDRVKRFLFLSSSLLLILQLSSVEASTMWSANGFWVEGGGSFAAINVDDYANANPALKLVSTSNGYRYIGLFTDGSLAGLKAGINEAGLFVSAAPALSINYDELKQLKRMSENLDKVLANCSTADEVAIAAQVGKLWGGQFLLVSDKNCTILIELTMGGAFKAEKRINNALCQTDHYVIYGLNNYNDNISKSSEMRYARINTLMNEEVARPISWQSFIAFLNDRIDGPDNSIWRQGSMEKGLRTVAGMVVSMPPQSSPKIYIQKVSPNIKTGENIMIVDEFKVEDIFIGNKAL